MNVDRNKLLLYIAAAYLTSLAFEGPIRLAFSAARIETLLYLRDALALFCVAYYAAAKFSDREYGIISIFSYAILCHAALGFWLGHPIISILFSIKIFISLLFGLCCGEAIKTNEKFVVNFLLFIFIGCSAGVFLNALYGTLPWEGAEFESAFGSATNRVWWAGGERRLPGFARISIMTAGAIGLSGIFLASYTNKYIHKFAILSIGTAAIYLTTSKGVIISFTSIIAWCLIPQGSARRRSGIAFLWISATLCATIPFASAYTQSSPNLIRSVPGFLSSFAERATVTWPTALADLDHWYLWLTGQGVGGIGGPLKYSAESVRYNPIDNLFLYTYTTFGIFGVFYYFFAAHRISLISKNNNNYSLGLLAMGIHFFVYGITAHQLENPFESIWIGMLIALSSKTAAPHLEKPPASRIAYNQNAKPKNT